MTGLLGGGHAIYFDAATRDAREPRLLRRGARARTRAPRGRARSSSRCPFGDELVHYAVGLGSCGVPGVPAGLDALWREHGRLPWARLVEPALRLARDGVPMPPAHAACLEMLAPVMTMNEGARIYSPGGVLLDEGDLLRQPGLVAALEALAEEGPRSVYDGSLAARAPRADGGARRARHGRRPRRLRGALGGAGRRSSSAASTLRTPRGALGLPGGCSRACRSFAASTSRRGCSRSSALARRRPEPDGHTTNLVRRRRGRATPAS